MKKHYFSNILTFLLLLTMINLSAQVGINSDNSQPDPSAMLDVKSNIKGFLPPRMTFEQRNEIQNPVDGLIVFCINCSASGDGVLSIYSGGKWQIFMDNCPAPNQPSAGIHIPSTHQIIWNWIAVPIASGYRWNTINDVNSSLDLGMSTSTLESGLTCWTSYSRYVWAYNDCGFSWPLYLSQTTSQIPIAFNPAAGTHVPSLTQIIWNWNSVSGAAGYKWNISNDFETAVDVGLNISFTEIELNCGTVFTRYVWAYNTCGTSAPTMLSQSTLNCPSICGQPFTDIRDGKTYNTVILGVQCWMSQNLNIGSLITNTTEQADNNIIEKYCYNDLESNCEVYGGLYQWGELVQYLNGASNITSWNPIPTGDVNGICPTGWHIPTDSEWNTLVSFLGGSSIAGGKLKESGTTHWAVPNTGATNSSGFTDLPGGFRMAYSGFNGLFNRGYHWTSSETSSEGSVLKRIQFDDETVYSNNYNKAVGSSVRCLKNL